MVKIGGELIKDSSLESFRKKGKKRDRSVVVYFRRIEAGVLQERIYSCLLQRVRWSKALDQIKKHSASESLWYGEVEHI